MRRDHLRHLRARAGRRTLALLMMAGVLLVGPLQSQTAAGTCAPSPGGGLSTRSLATVVGEASGVPVGLNETSIRWTRWHTRVVYGSRATLEGQVVTEDGAIPDATVNLLAREAGSDDWVAAGSATSDSDTGVFSFTCLEPSKTTEYRAVYPGTLLYSSSEGHRTVQVARRVPDTMTQVASTRFRFQGAVEPRYAGRPVLLERKSCSACRWSKVARTETSSRSRWRFTIEVSSFTGHRWYRAVVPADASYVRSHSARTWRLTHR